MANSNLKYMKKYIAISLIVVVAFVAGGFITSVLHQPDNALGAKEAPVNDSKKDKIIIKDGKKYLEETIDETRVTEYDEEFYLGEEATYVQELAYIEKSKKMFEDKLKETRRQLKLFK